MLRIAGAAAALVVVTYAPHVWRVGSRVVGYLPGYLREEHYQRGGRFLVAGLLRVPQPLAGPVSVIAVAVVVGWVVWRRPRPAVALATALGALLLAVSPVQPWYAVALLAVAALAAQPRWVAVVIAGYPYFFAVILDNRHAMVIGEASYTAALMVVAAIGVSAWRRSSSPVSRPSPASPPSPVSLPSPVVSRHAPAPL
jgi:hypothetical protein